MLLARDLGEGGELGKRSVGCSGGALRWAGLLSGFLCFAECHRSGHSAKWIFFLFFCLFISQKKDFYFFVEYSRSGHSAKFFYFSEKRFYFFAECLKSGHSAKFFLFFSSHFFPEKRFYFFCQVS